MIKNTVLALVAVATVAGIAAPTFAAENNRRPFGERSIEWREFKANSILAQLRQSGVDATSVEEWGGLVRAYVRTADGGQEMQFFVPGSLQLVTR